MGHDPGFTSIRINSFYKCVDWQWVLVMGTGNPGVSPERPRPVPLNTLTLGAGQGILRVWVQVWRGFEGIRVE
jgi:hypothetical protein